jgi:hypothetical protein
MDKVLHPLFPNSFFSLSAWGPTHRRNSTGLAELRGGWPIELVIIRTLPGGTAGYPAHPPSVRLSSDITFNYSAEILLIPTIKATIETSWY